MPTFPQHRNIKGAKTVQAQEGNLNTGAGDQTNNLPAISDLVRFKYFALYYINKYLIVNMLFINVFLVVGIFGEEETCGIKERRIFPLHFGLRALVIIIIVVFDCFDFHKTSYKV